MALVSGPDDYNRGFRRIVLSLISLVIVPTALLLVIGTVMLVFYDLRANLVFGLLVMTLVGCLIAGVVLALVFVRKEANLSRLQLDFVSKVSHELRTPLTSIRMFVETLRYEHEPARVATCLDVLQRETERLSGRIERLLDWGRMEAGKRVYELQREDAAQVISTSLEHFRSAYMGQDRTVNLELPRDLPPIMADRGALEDALLNLLANAHKYSPAEQPIAVRAFSDRQYVYIAVEDYGIGIARNEHHRVFDKFYRSDDRLSRSIEGSGLGLAIVQHVATGHRGKITLRSAPGRGSTFTLAIPIANPQIEPQRAHGSRPPRSTAEEA
jgi:two-component system phosphate regulon sensor histidine kinase PhoR